MDLSMCHSICPSVCLRQEGKWCVYMAPTAIHATEIQDLVCDLKTDGWRDRTGQADLWPDVSTEIDLLTPARVCVIAHSYRNGS